MTTTAAVVGAGPLGLMAVKNLIEQGFETTCFDGRSYIGGLWQKSDDSLLSVQSNTRFNSSRYRSAFSDWPFPDDTDDFPRWSQMTAYLESYADHFDLWPSIRLRSLVKAVNRRDGKWVLQIEAEDGIREQIFDKLLVATGLFTKPRWPSIPGIDTFEGDVLHAQLFHDPEKYRGKNVLLVGMHATAQDAATSLGGIANKIYVSHRHGILMVSEYEPNGLVYDAGVTVAVNNALMFMFTWFPRLTHWLMHLHLNSMMHKYYPALKESWRFKPTPAPFYTNPFVANNIYSQLVSRVVEPVMGIHRITGPKSIQLDDDAVLNDIDAIIWCTGYDTTVPFLPAEYNPYPVPGQVGNLYRNTFLLHPDPSVRNSLAFLGHAFIPFSGFPPYEVLSMAIAQIWKGNSSLPSFAEMKKWQTNFLTWRSDLSARQSIQSSFYPARVPYADHLRWIDETAGTDVFAHFGIFSFKAWSFWWQDPHFYKLCKFGLFSPAIWRLFETGRRKAWSGAREQIYKDNEASKRQVAARLTQLEREQSEKVIYST